MKTRVAIVVVGLGLVLGGMLATPAIAHHAFSAEFDSTRPLHMEGVVVKMEWINPHSWVHVEVTNDDGSKTTWMVEGGTPNTLFRRGFTQDSLLPGNGDRHRRLPGERWVGQDEWSRHDFPRWSKVVPRFVRNRRAGRWSGTRPSLDSSNLLELPGNRRVLSRVAGDEGPCARHIGGSAQGLFCVHSSVATLWRRCEPFFCNRSTC